jgi:hypothetical protein
MFHLDFLEEDLQEVYFLPLLFLFQKGVHLLHHLIHQLHYLFQILLLYLHLRKLLK